MNVIRSIFEGESRTYVISSKKTTNKTKLVRHKKGKEKQTNKQKNKNNLHSDIYRPISFKFGMVIDSVELYTFDASLDDLGLHSDSQLYKKSKTSTFICSKFTQSVVMKYGMLSYPDGLLNHAKSVLHD